MSDRELVTFNAEQFTTLIGRWDTLNNTLWNINRQLQQRENEKLDILIRKVDEFMATQEERLQTIQGQLTSIADGINTLQQQLADLKASNPAIEDEIAAIEGTVKAIADDLNPPPPTP